MVQSPRRNGQVSVRHLTGAISRQLQTVNTTVRVINHTRYRRSDISADLEQENESDEFPASSSRKRDVTIFRESTRKQPTASLSAKELRKSFMVHQL